ncbi:hypothetical protein [Bradyrhizobium sp. AC87j1]|nr:hypothetical protein [Bradyrhizobium sp. AC87j1]
MRQKSGPGCPIPANYGQRVADVYTPDLNIDAIEVKARNFR